MTFGHPESDALAGVYVHIPFCERRCPYCDFAVSVQLEVPHEAYAEAVRGELRRRQEELKGREVRTLYFGGGTPSLLAPKALASLIEEVDALFGLGEEVEITLEANPNQVSEENLRAWRSLGINRLSIGCQSFQDRYLKALRRNHSGAQALEAVERALAVMDRVSLDLLFGGPSQSIQEWEADLAIMQRLAGEQGLDHLSGYNMTIEPNTAFWIRRKRGTLVIPDDDMAAEMLERLVEAAEQVGLARYEVSSFSLPGHESRHNSFYWQGVPYLGAGVGAHSLELLESGAVRRRANPWHYEKYMNAPGEPDMVEELSALEHLGERLFLGARSTIGLHFGSLREQFAPLIGTPKFEKIQERLDDLVARGWMKRGRDEIYIPTEKGLNFTDSLAQWLFEALD